MRLDSLPSQYEPFKEIEIGTNRLVEGRVLFTVNENVPLLIGAGKIPRIWLSIPADPKGETWQPLVRDNRSLHAKVTVKVEHNQIAIDTPDGEVLRARKEHDKLVKVLAIDLRPFGINIYGDENMLTVMNNNLSGNTFVNVKVMVGIGGAPKNA